MRYLDDFIDKVKTLPPAPRVLLELLALLSEDDVDTSRVVAVISYDPALTANVLQLCNSAYFGLASPVEDLNEGVTRLGFNQIYQLVAAIIGGRTMNSAQKGYGIDKGELWKHAVASALSAQLIARHLGEPEALVYTSTLLHDIGKIVLSEALEYVYSRLVEETEKNQQSLLDTEMQLLGVNHAEIGARLLERWHFPSNLIDAVRYHHAPKEAGPNARLASQVYLGNMLAHFMGLGFGHQPFALRGRAESIECLNLNPDELPHFMIATFDKLSIVDAMLHISGGEGAGY
jgi:putative nucleotidyltransferase with HDIG domain